MCPNVRSLLWVMLLCVVPASRAGSIAYDLDYAAFADLHGDTSHSYVEIYFRVDRWSLEARPTSVGNRRFGFMKGEPDTLVVGFVADVAVTDGPADTLAHERHIVRQPLTERSSGTAYDDLFTTIGFYLPPGSHTLTTLVSDETDPRNVVRQETPLIVRSYAPPEPILSDLELALSASRDESGGRYTKHGLSILPNARCTFGFGAPILYFYTEVYNLDPHAAYRFEAAFLDSAGNAARRLGPFAIERQGPTSVQVKGVNLMGWVDGRYELVVSLFDSGGATLSRCRKPLSVSRAPHITPPTIKKFIDDVSWIATRAELAEFERLPLEEKAPFIEEFWRKRDPDPETPYNEMKQEHFRRLWLADEWFAEPGLPGRTSDQGRVLIQYGPPNDIERQASSMEGRPYEIWFYNEIEGGVQFVFVDFAGSGRMNLVHSTARDEIHNENWRRLAEPYEGTFQRWQRRTDEMRDRQR